MSDDGFIGLPPGMAPPQLDTDSGTIRRERSERPARPVAEPIVFFPAAPGAAPPVAEETIAAPPAEVAEPPAARRAAPAWRLAVPGHDEPVLVEGSVFLGRNPIATPGVAPASVVAVDDPAKSVSKTHAVVEVDEAGLWVRDLDSTNGVWVVPQGADAIEVAPGDRVSVPHGAELELGDFVIGVEHA
jgi:hypothetical protein